MIEGKKNGTDQKKRPSIKIKKKENVCREDRKLALCLCVVKSIHFVATG